MTLSSVFDTRNRLLSTCFFFYDPATTESYTYGRTLSLHDALPILLRRLPGQGEGRRRRAEVDVGAAAGHRRGDGDVHQRRARPVGDARRRDAGVGRIPGQGRWHAHGGVRGRGAGSVEADRKSTRLNSSH